jgi:hypothetical protein
MYQAVCIFTPVSAHTLAGSHPLGSVPSHTLLSFASPADRQDFVESPSVWWYQFAEDIDMGGEGGAIGQRRASWANPQKAGRWTRGGAWEAAEAELALEAEQDAQGGRGGLW